MIASFVIDVVPVAKGRPRITARNGFARAYTPAKTRSFETLVAEHARDAMGAVDPFGGPVEVEAHFLIPVPKSWRKRDKIDAVAGRIRPQGRPDIDNYFKSLADGMNGIVFADDGQIVSARLTKRYADEPGVAVTVRPA